MNLLFRVLFAAHCRSTHHKLALDALRHLECPRAERWRNLFLTHHEVYFVGAKAPDKKFKDFRNHVLHVEQNYWGGAPKAARKWYDRTVEALQRSSWSDAVYSAGVMSHYCTDPIQPFHTGQSEAENNIHRAAEWSITKSYSRLREIFENRSELPVVALPSGDDWLESMIAQGAELAHRHYDSLIKRYNFAKGVKDPPRGLDTASRKFLAQLVGFAAISFARVLERAFEEANVRPPRTEVTLVTFLATLQMPVRWITKKMGDARERALVESMYNELQRTGRVEKYLPEDDRAVRELIAKESQNPRRQSSPATTPRATTPSTNTSSPKLAPPDTSPTRKQGTDSELPKLSHRASETTPGATRDDQSSAKLQVTPPVAPTTRRSQPEREEPLRFYLAPSKDIEDAPSIGPKTARRLARIGVRTVADLFAVNPDRAAAKLKVRHIKANTIRDWQDQAKLVCRIPNLRGHDAQILVACGYRDPAAVAEASVEPLLAKADEFADSSEGQRVIRSGKKPDREEVTNWIRWAGQARRLRAA